MILLGRVPAEERTAARKAHLCEGLLLHLRGRWRGAQGRFWSTLPVPPQLDRPQSSSAQLFCQNLSLFSKLFLENKSVCFDLSAFNYYLLVYDGQPPSGPSYARQGVSGQGTSHQVIGFFSKEKMSWDHNNLACILIFPPWQRRGLGKVLMGVSYELGRREERMGGPEKRESRCLPAESADVQS